MADIPLPSIPTAPEGDLGSAMGLDANGEARRHALRPFVERKLRAVSSKTGAAYTLVAADAGTLIRRMHSGACSVSIPLSVTVPFAIGTQVWVMQDGAGAARVTVDGVLGVAVRSTPAQRRKTRAQYSVVQMICIGPDEWVVTGDAAI